ncbi:AAA family ATPase [Cyanobium sp. BA20m-p-22]|nr:AAA family ATPase [Cyanobium sp. BA20m-p-22]MCP9911144.1 AAA family ATPase [Cyanobium sp. BA20m-p-22]
MLDAARRDPEALLGGHGPTTLDEVQREPGLLSAVKRAIDRNRSAGRFLLTGSANLLLMRQVSESLAGRASYLTLWPMKDGATCWPPGTSTRRIGVRWRIGAAFPHRQSSWPVRLAGYVRTYLERDLQDLATISSLPDFRRLMQAACLRLGQLLNQTELGRDLALPQPTVHRWPMP